MHYKFHRTLVGGTFDHLHVGHKRLIQTAFDYSEKVIIGISTDELFRDKAFASLIEKYQIREQHVRDFLSERGILDRASIVPIHDFYGTTLTDKDLDAIFITESNKENVVKINEERQKKGFPPLEIVVVSYARGNDGHVISSERVRKGEMDREGNSYEKLFMGNHQFILPISEREALREPMGAVFSTMQDVISAFGNETIFIAVGDIVAESLMKLGKPAAISIIDGKTRRELVSQHGIKSFPEIMSRATDNPAGTITQKAAKSIMAALRDFEATHKRQLIVVSGEEDLLAIPAILLSPLHVVVLYGQFNVGIIAVKTSEQSKEHVYNLFGKFQ